MEPTASPLSPFSLRREPRLAGLIEQLQGGAVYAFEAWPVPDVPSTSGAYTIWRRDEFLYVGVASGPGYRPAQPPAPGSDVKGLRAQLRGHWLGFRSGDPFTIYVCDKLVMPQLSRKQQADLRIGKLSLDALTKNYIHAELSFRFAPTANTAEAQRIERLLRRHGLPGAGKPVLNPTTTS